MNKLNIENSYQLEISLLTSWSAPIGRLEYRHRRSPVIGCLDSTHSHNVVGPVKHQHKKYPGILDILSHTRESLQPMTVLKERLKDAG